MVAQRDAVPRRRLAGNGDAALGDVQRLAQRDGARHLEHHRARALRLHGGTQRAVAVVGQCRHMEDPAAAATEREGAFALGAGEGGQRGGRQRGGAAGEQQPSPR